MDASRIGLASGVWPKWAVLLATWTLCVATLIIVTANNRPACPHNDAIVAEPLFGAPTNQIGPCWFRRWDPNHDYRPVHFIGFENLRAEDARVGIFKTALHKVVTIEDLQLRLAWSETGEQLDPDETSPFAMLSSLFDPATRPHDKMPMGRALRRLKGKITVWLPSIDLSNVSQAVIKNLEYEIFDGDDLVLGVRCRRACLSSRSPEKVVLRGQAMITTAGGRSLRGNEITWSLRNNRFVSDDVCVLTRDGRRTACRGARVDGLLNIVSAEWTRAMTDDENGVSRTLFLSRLDRQREYGW